MFLKPSSVKSRFRVIPCSDSVFVFGGHVCTQCAATCTREQKHALPALLRAPDKTEQGTSPTSRFLSPLGGAFSS